MRDGVQLATDVYLPDGPGPFPAVLVRLPYDKNGRYCWMPFMATHFVARGYAFVPQDVRGSFRSEGEPLAFVNEVADGYDTIEWIARQPWSNGDVGMWGDSYYGFTQWAAVASGHPALKAIVPRVTFADLDGWLEGVTPLYGAHYLAEFWTDHNTHEWTPDWSRRPLARGLRRRLRGHRQPLGLVRLRARALARRRARRSSPTRTPSTSCASRRCTASAGSTTSRLRTCSTTRRSSEPRNGAVPVPARRLDRPRELRFEHCRSRSPTITPPHDDALERDAAGLHRAGARLLRRVPDGPDRSGLTSRACAGTSRTPAGRSRPLAAAGRLRAAPLPRRRRARGRTTPGRLARAGAGRASRGDLGARPRDLVPSTSSTRSRRSSSIRTSARSRRAPTCSRSRRRRLDEPITLAGRVVAHLAVSSDGPRCSCTSSSSTSTPDGRAHALLFGQQVVDDSGAGRDRRGLPRPHRLPPAARTPPAPARRPSDFPVFLPHPGTDENPWDATATRTNRQTLATGARRRPTSA